MPRRRRKGRRGPRGEPWYKKWTDTWYFGHRGERIVFRGHDGRPIRGRTMKVLEIGGDRTESPLLSLNDADLAARGYNPC
jgi:hypothetical protein